MKNRNSAKFLYLLILMLITFIAFSTTTYAWFTSNRVVTVRTINIHVAASGGVEISADGLNWKSVIDPEDIMEVHDTTYRRSVNQIPNEMQPVSTGKEVDTSTGYLKMYYGTTDTDRNGDAFLASERSIEVEGNGPSSDGKFVVFDLFFKVNGDTQLYLTNESRVTYLDEENGKGIAAATRIAFVDEGTVPKESPLPDIQGLRRGNNGSVYIWEPNYDVHTDAAIMSAQDLFGINTSRTNATRINYDGVINNIPSSAHVLIRNANSSSYPYYFKRVNIDYATKQNFTENVPAFTIKGGITKVRVYMWIEGQDIDCENNASYDDIQFDLQLTVNPT